MNLTPAQAAEIIRLGNALFKQTHDPDFQVGSFWIELRRQIKARAKKAGGEKKAARGKK